MNAHSRPLAVKVSETYEFDCAACDGAGEIFGVARVAGEFFDADLTSTHCDACGGAGSFLLCSYCDAELEAGETCSACADDLEPIVDAVRAGLPIIKNLGMNGVGL